MLKQRYQRRKHPLRAQRSPRQNTLRTADEQADRSSLYEGRVISALRHPRVSSAFAASPCFLSLRGIPVLSQPSRHPHVSSNPLRHLPCSPNPLHLLLLFEFIKISNYLQVDGVSVALPPLQQSLTLSEVTSVYWVAFAVRRPVTCRTTPRVSRDIWCETCVIDVGATSILSTRFPFTLELAGELTTWFPRTLIVSNIECFFCIC